MGARYVDKNGYSRGKLKHSDLIHRQVAYKEIYLKRREEYPKPFSFYQVHHIDNDKQNNDVTNLMVLSKEDHEKIHGISKSDINENEIIHDNWENKKYKSNVEGDFSLIRLLIGSNFTNILLNLFKLSLFFGVFFLLVSVFFEKAVLIHISSFFFVVFVLLLILIIILSTIGWVYSHIGNILFEFRRIFRK